MGELLLIGLGAALVNNFVLVQFLGLCPVLGVGGRIDSALGMAAATTVVLALTAVLAWLADHFLLRPLGLEFLRTIAFIVIVAGTVQLADSVIRHGSPILHRLLGIYLPLITTNCAVLGVALLNVNADRTFAGALAAGLGAGLGFTLVIVAFATLRERLESADVPMAFRGGAVALVTAGMLSLAFIGFTGLGSS